MTESFASDVYDILVKFGADPEDKDDFIYNHCNTSNRCTEWRFWGVFGFGGKYRSITNSVSTYSEDITEDMSKLLDECNLLLKQIKA